MTGLLADYLPLIIFLGVSLFIAVALLIAPFIVAYSSPDPEKLSAYECGFNAFDDARMKFDVRFYLVAILFIIFDLEVAFLFPWAITFGELGWFGFWSMMIFLAFSPSASSTSGARAPSNGTSGAAALASFPFRTRSEAEMALTPTFSRAPDIAPAPKDHRSRDRPPDRRQRSDLPVDQ